jgi:hypothetical protein
LLAALVGVVAVVAGGWAFMARSGRRR